MSCLDVLYAQTITLFNRKPGQKGDDTVWIPTVIEGVHLIINRASSWDSRGGRAQDNATLNIRYQKSDSDVLVKCKDAFGQGADFYKKWYEPKAWKKLASPDNVITFSFGDNEDFDFFVEGTHAEFGPAIKDSDFQRKSFYWYMNNEYDNVFAISSVSRFSLIPHFTISAR